MLGKHDSKRRLARQCYLGDRTMHLIKDGWGTMLLAILLFASVVSMGASKPVITQVPIMCDTFDELSETFFEKYPYIVRSGQVSNVMGNFIFMTRSNENSEFIDYMVDQYGQSCVWGIGERLELFSAPIEGAV